MALPSGSFASPYPGSLRVSVSALFTASSVNSGEIGSWIGDASTVVLRAYIDTNNGRIYLPTISRAGPSSEVTLTYPGGNENWPMAVEHLAHNYSGSGAMWVAAEKIYLIAELTKK